MNTSHRDELREILGADDAAASLLAQHKIRRDKEIDHAARNLSVTVAARMQKKHRSGKIGIAGLAIASAAAIAIMISFNPTLEQSKQVAGDSRVSTATNVNVQDVSAPQLASVSMPTRSKARRTEIVSDESILVQEAENQLVDLIADAVSDESLYTITNEDVDMILQENNNDNGL